MTIKDFIDGPVFYSGDANPTICVNIKPELQQLLQTCVKNHLPFNGWDDGDGDQGHFSFQYPFNGDARYWVAGVFEDDIQFVEWPHELIRTTENDAEDIFKCVLYVLAEYAADNVEDCGEGQNEN